MLKFSFILPCYNVAPYVGRCIDSIENQNIPQTEYEIICVDDCSKDNTTEIIKQYQSQYANVKLVYHATNQTAGGARNTGIKEAKGKYLWFVDPDDVIFPNVLQIITNKLDKFEVDILFFNYQTQDESGESVDSKYPQFNGEISGEKYISKYSNGKISAFSNIYSCVFQREYIVKNKIVYPKLRASQDVVFIWTAIICSKRCAVIADICYKYIRRSDSVTGSKGKYSARAIMSQSLLFAIEIKHMLQKYPQLETSITNNMLNAIRCALNDESRKILQASYSNQRNFYRMLSQYEEDISDLQSYMNRKTKNIFRRYKGWFIIWFLVINGYKMVNLFK